MFKKLIVRNKSLIKYIKNWPVYLLYKWKGFPTIAHFNLRKHGIRLAIPKETMSVFKEFFMTNAYSFEFLNLYLKKQAVVIDIGANIGLFPIRLLIKQPDLRIYCYEPFPNNFEILSRNVSGNPFISNNVQIFNQAVLGRKKDDLKIYFNRERFYTDSSSVVPGFENNHDAISVACTSLQEIITDNHLLQIDLLKLDCEGSEYSILYDTPVDLINKIPFIVVETHDLDEERNNIQGVKMFLGALGFTLKTKPVTDKINMIWAWK